MKNLNQQRGMATLLLVLLIGISIMLITAGFARSLTTKKEASVTAHAQTNAQLMGWSGVSAFREYIMATGRSNPSAVLALNGQTITLRNDANKKEIIAKNIRVQGCTTDNPVCTVNADISSDNKTAQAATTIQVVYDLDIKSTPGNKDILSFTGDTSFISSSIDAEVPNTKAVLNVDGSTRILGGLKTNNISELVINSKGDVNIDCSGTLCTTAKITIFAEGQVHITDHGLNPKLNIGNIKANKDVYLQTNVKAGHIESGDDVRLATGASAESISAHKNVMLSDRSRATTITSNKNITLLSNSTAQSLRAKGHIDISASTVQGDTRAYEYVDLDTGAIVKGSVYAQGLSFIPNTVDVGVRMITSNIEGKIYARKNLRILDVDFQKDINQDVFLTGYVRSSYIWPVDIQAAIRRHIGGSLNEYQTTISALDFTIDGINPQTLNREILEQTDFITKVDVRLYKQDSNYIFTSANGIDRVYLNHLKNAATNITYIYENNEQYAVALDGTKTKISSEGFHIGRYVMNGRDYIGAICKDIQTEGNILTHHAQCTSEIIGYLPRMSVSTTLNIDNDYDYLPASNDWHIRTTSAASTLENAAFAPGIFYFEGNLHISGNGNWNGDSTSNVFTNTFLAEGDLNAIAASPRIYSPYNVIRDGQAALICDRSLKNINSTTPSITTPATLSTKYLIPVNLCRDQNTFSYDMNKDEQGNNTYVNIDNTSVKKLDLGYVALMGNQVVRIGACAQIYGDVLSRGTIEGSAACGLTNNTNKIVGNVSSQGEPPYITGAQQHNTFGLGSKIVIPKSEFTNAKESAGGTGVNRVALTWSRYQ